MLKLLNTFKKSTPLLIMLSTPPRVVLPDWIIVFVEVTAWLYVFFAWPSTTCNKIKIGNNTFGLNTADATAKGICLIISLLTATSRLKFVGKNYDLDWFVPMKSCDQTEPT